MNINPPHTDQLPSLLALPTAARAKRYDVTDQRRTLSFDYRGPASAGSRSTLRMNGVGERKRETETETETETERQRQRDRQTEIQRERERDRQTDRQTRGPKL